jgi:pimeloyl-ACP methyl ester carboxylesterase
MEIRAKFLTVVAIALLTASTTSILFSLTVHYPLRYALPLAQEDYDITFWNLTDSLSEPLDIRNISRTVVDFMVDAEQVRLVEWRFNYSSSLFNGGRVRINSILLFRENETAPRPSVLLLHGYASQAADFYSMLWDLAVHGYVALAIDAPGCGWSNGPLLTPATLFNVTDGPTSSHLYHSVWAAARAIALLESLPNVATDSNVVLGASMGGIEALILSAIDSRVDGSIPVLSAGNLRNALMSGSFLNALIDPAYTMDSPQMADVLRWFDPIPYARLLTKPVLMMSGTNDEFFPLVSLCDTVEQIEANLSLALSPNSGHDLIPERSRLIRNWLREMFEGVDEVPSVRVDHTQTLTLLGNGVRVHATNTDDSPLYVLWRSGEPGASWISQLMTHVGDDYYADIVPYGHSDILFFVSTSGGVEPGFTSGIYTSFGGSILVPVTAAASALCLVFLVMRSVWRPSLSLLKQQIPILVGLGMIGSGLIFPFFGIGGRTDLSILSFIEIYGNIFLLNGWFLPSVLGMTCLILGLSAFRMGLPLKLTVVLWFPLLLIFTILYLVFAGFFSLSGAFGLLYDSIGIYLLLLSVPVLTVLETYLRRTPADVLIDEKDLADLESLVSPEE